MAMAQFLMGHSRPLFVFSTVNMFCKKIANDCIRTVDLWDLKQPLCHLKQNHNTSVTILVVNFNIFDGEPAARILLLRSRSNLYDVEGVAQGAGWIHFRRSAKTQKYHLHRDCQSGEESNDLYDTHTKKKSKFFSGKFCCKIVLLFTNFSLLLLLLFATLMLLLSSLTRMLFLFIPGAMYKTFLMCYTYRSVYWV